MLPSTPGIPAERAGLNRSKEAVRLFVHRMRARRPYLVVMLAVALLAPSFAGNAWKLVDQAWFDRFQQDSESLVVWGLVETGQHGPWSSRFKLETPSYVSNWWTGADDAYRRQRQFPQFDAYTSQIGLQGFAYSALRVMLPISNGSFLTLMRVANSVLLAASLGVIAWWVSSLGSPGTALVALALLACSPFLTSIGRNLYWVAWTWFLPMLVAIAWTSVREPDSGIRRGELASVAVAVFAKSACGYEYVSVVLVAMALPYLAWGLSAASSIGRVVRQWAAVAAAGISGFALAVLVHAVQRSSLTDIRKGLAAIWIDVARRTTHTSIANSLPEILAKSVSIPVREVLVAYWQSCVVQVPGIACIRARTIVEAIALGWILLLVARALSRASGPQFRRGCILGATASVAVLGPLSWFVLAKGHSYLHQHLNHVVWAVPAPLLATAFLATGVGSLLRVDRWAAPLHALPSIVAVALLLAHASIEDVSLRLGMLRRDPGHPIVAHGSDLPPRTTWHGELTPRRSDHFGAERLLPAICARLRPSAAPRYNAAPAGLRAPGGDI